jgi:hypothetical protein
MTVNESITALLKIKTFRYIVLFSIPVVLEAVILISCFISDGSQQYADLAKAFLHGQLNFLAPIGGLGQDPVFWHGKIYWDDGPFPAILLMPFVAFFSLFHLVYYQGYLMWILALGVPYFVYKIAQIFKYSIEDSLILAFGFALGTVFIGVVSISSSWFFGQVLNTFLLFWAFYEYFTNRRWWLIGIICALVFMTRATSTPLLLFFALEIWQLKLSKSKRFRMLLGLATPVGIAIVLIGLYNYLRFQSPFNGGYQSQLLHGNAIESRAMGIFSLKHIPSNFYYMVLTAPNPVLRDSGSWTLKFPFISNNMYGTSIFITSPYLLYLFQQKWKTFDVHSRNLIVATTLTALFVLSYYGVGLMQFGYRYSLDFLPGMFILFMIIYRKHHRSISRGMKFLLLGAGVLNFYLLWTLI